MKYQHIKDLQKLERTYQQAQDRDTRVAVIRSYAAAVGLAEVVPLRATVDTSFYAVAGDANLPLRFLSRRPRRLASRIEAEVVLPGLLDDENALPTTTELYEAMTSGTFRALAAAGWEGIRLGAVDSTGKQLEVIGLFENQSLATRTITHPYVMRLEQLVMSDEDVWSGVKSLLPELEYPVVSFTIALDFDPTPAQVSELMQSDCVREVTATGIHCEIPAYDATPAVLYAFAADMDTILRDMRGGLTANYDETKA